MQEFYASSSPGCEGALCDELRELGFASVRLNRGGIPFRGAWSEGWRACLQSRIAQRILVVLHRFPAPTPEALLAGARDVDWGRYLAGDRRFAVSAVSRGAPPALANDDFVALKVKDAIVDRLRDTTGHRPSVARDDPDVRVFLYLADTRATLYLDLAGEPLHRRGYRLQTGEAPLRETLAAAVLRLSGWDRRQRLLDPMCGAGTLAIEAALWSGNIAPGLARERFGFERWATFGDAEAVDLRVMRGALRRQAAARTARVVAADQDPAVLAHAQANARAAGVRLAFREQSAFDLMPDGAPGMLLTNPPYGVRLATDSDFYRRFGAMVTRLHGWKVGVLAGSPELARGIPLRPYATHPLRNGDLECALLMYDVP